MTGPPIGEMEKRWELCKRGFELCKARPVLFGLPSVIGALIVLPLVVRLVAILIYAIVSYCAVNSHHRERPRIRDVFGMIPRYSGAVLLWLLLIACIELSIVLTDVWTIPIIWAIAMLAFPPSMEAHKAVRFARRSPLKTVFAWQNWARFWLVGLIIPLVCYRGVPMLLFGLVVAVPIAICIRVIVYGDTLNLRSAFQTQYSGHIFRIGQQCDQIVEQIRSANNDVKPLLEGSVQYLDSMYEKAVDLSQRLQQIEQYLQTTNKKTLQSEKARLTKQLSKAPNRAVSAQYAEALRMLEQQDENHGRLEVLRKEISARLTTIRLALDNTHAKIIRIKTTGLTNARLESDSVSETLQNLQIETDVLLESIDEMGRN